MARGGEDTERERSQRPDHIRKILKKAWPRGQGPRASGRQESQALRGDQEPGVKRKEEELQKGQVNKVREGRIVGVDSEDLPKSSPVNCPPSASYPVSTHCQP